MNSRQRTNSVLAATTLSALSSAQFLFASPVLADGATAKLASTAATTPEQIKSLKELAESVKTPRMANDKQWEKKHTLLVQKAATTRSELQFYGDSITEFIENESYHNLKAFKEYFGKYDPQNFGIAGDTSGELLWRVNNGEVGGSPKLAVVLIGTNDLTQFVPIPTEKTIENIGNVVKTIQALKPGTKVLVMGLLPRASDTDERKKYFDEKIATINKAISKLDNGDSIRFIDLSDDFLTNKKAVNVDVMPDYLHPNFSGYEIWAKGIKNIVHLMLGSEAAK